MFANIRYSANIENPDLCSVEVGRMFANIPRMFANIPRMFANISGMFANIQFREHPDLGNPLT